jgi:protein ImuB
LVELAQLQLERLRIASPVSAIRVAAVLTAPLEPPRQAVLFEQSIRHSPCAGPAHGVCGIHLAALVERLSSRLGPAAVLGVRLRPEAQPELAWRYGPLVGKRRRNVAGTRRVPAPHTACAGYIELPPRPLRLLPRPVPLVIVGALRCVPLPKPTGCNPWACEAANGQAALLPPRCFRLDGREHRIARHWGPERIETGWWRGRAVGRDYFRVETAAGCRYWLFRRLRDGKWFLHGVFE